MSSEKKELQVKCPICKKEKKWKGNPFRPFCCERCSLIDLGKWAEGEYKLPENPLSGSRDE